MWLAPTFSDETRGSSRVMSCSLCPEHPSRGSAICEVRGELVPSTTRGTLEPSTPAGDDARAGQAGAPQRASNPYFGSTPPEAYFRPDRQNILRRRAQQRSRTAGTPTERLAHRFQAAP
jgi:hypothetical protein